MTGGIYCEVPLGPIFQEGKIVSIHEHMKTFFGTSKGVPDNKTITDWIIDTWYNNVSRKMGRILSSWRVPGNRGYYNRTVDLTRSFCMGVYKNGKLRKKYRFTGGSREKEALEASDMGTSPSKGDMKRLSWLGARRHPDPADRAESFLKDYDLVHKSGYAVVIAATMPYAVRLEIGYQLPVLGMVINRITSTLDEFNGGSKGIYGYIFESTGGYGE